MRIITKNSRAMILVIALFMLMQNSRAQVIQEVQNSFNLYKQNAFIEKIYVHTDKSVYLPGEILWFKVYCVDGNDHKPLNLSKVVYIEVLDNNQSRIVEAKVAMKNGSGDGSLYIPVSVSNGNYKLRAYTSWMKNFGPDFYFEKPITFVNPLKSPDAVTKQNAAAYDINFFPEGGNLVNGIKSKVAFKAVGQNGKGAGLSGVVVNQKNDTVARFKSLKFGMGSFSFTPEERNFYKAIIQIDGSPLITKDIPAANSQGYVMSLSDNASGQLEVTVKENENLSGNVYLFVHTRQMVKVAESAAANNGTAIFRINKSDLGEGISHITVFNDAKQPVCERLYFKRPAQRLLIAAGADQPQYGTRKKVTVNVQAKDPAGKALNADMSMSVYRVDSLQAIDGSNIFSYLWLNSDLKGSIESPDFYFRNVNAESDEALDNLMLTQGWRRFQWKDILENRAAAFSFLPEYTGHIITAKIVKSDNGAPAKNIMTYLGIPGKRVQLYTSQSDSSGRLLYETKDFYGAGEVIAQTNELIDSTYRIDILSPFSEQYTKEAAPKFEFNTGQANALKDHSIGIQVLNIYSGDMLKRYYDPHVDSSAFYGKPYKTYKLDDFTRFTTMEEDLREYVSEDNIVKTKGYFHIKVLNNKGFLDSDPLVLLDGIPVFNMNKVFTVDPLKVRKLEVVPFRYYYGPSTEEGIFSFTTYKGDLGGVELDPRAIVVDYEGMQLSRQFYSPVYDTETRTANRLPDFRNLLYWTPYIKQHGAGDGISFYTSDEPGTYVGVIQGLTPKGEPGSAYFTFEVK